jgi:uncharacterized membrane protein YjfL (UPF0719 family)
MSTVARLGAPPFLKRNTSISIVGISVALSVILIASGLWRWGAVEVRGHWKEVCFLSFFGTVWIFAFMGLFSWFGLSMTDDAIDRGNPAALIALCGATFSVAIIYVAGNLGEGPEYWNNFFSAALGTISFFTVWFIVELCTRVSCSIAEDRDLASGIRHCGFLLGVGLILARAIAGNWHSASATVSDLFRDGWPVIFLCFVAIFVERTTRPIPRRPRVPVLMFGLFPALAWLAAGIGWIFFKGP